MSREDEIKAALADQESFRVERTESLTNSDKFGEAICAFANDMPQSGQPGYLFIGVDRQGKPTGANVDDRLLESLAGLRDNGNIIPIPNMNVQKITIDGKAVAVIEVFPSDSPPVRFKQTVWIRTGPSKDRATAAQERILEERRVDRAATWDMKACTDASLDDLAIDLFKLNYLPRSVSREVIEENGRSLTDQLGSLRFWHRRRDCPTNAAVLLFGKDPISFFPGAYVQYVKYSGDSQASDVLAEQRVSGDFLTVLRDLDALARKINETRPVRIHGSLAEETVSTYPELALHELFMNAVVHRNYETTTTPVQINQYEDRLEIQNPGSLYGDLTRDLFPNQTAYRNPVLAEAAKILGFANRFGRGIALAKKLLRENKSPELQHIIGENHMAMIVRRRT